MSWPTSSPPSVRRRCSCWIANEWCDTAAGSTISTAFRPELAISVRKRCSVIRVAVEELLAGKPVSQVGDPSPGLPDWPFARRRRKLGGNVFEPDRPSVSSACVTCHREG